MTPIILLIIIFISAFITVYADDPLTKWAALGIFLGANIGVVTVIL